MKTEFRNRAFLPVALPVMILVGMAAFIGLFAWIMLYNTKDGALALAAVMATGVLVSIALASTADELDARRKAGVLLAFLIPVVTGAALAGTGGGVDDEALLNINREEISVVPEINVTVHALNSSRFEETSVTLPAGVDAAIVFVNEEVGVPHNIAYTLAPGGTQPELTPIAATEIAAGPDESFLTINDAPGTYWYWCQVHPNMNGLLELADGATPAAA